MISVLCPSRARPEQARELLETIRATAILQHVELILRLDDDDPYLADYADQVTGTDVTVLVDKRVVLSKCWNDAAAVARNDVLMLCGDDIRFRTEGWDKRVLETIYNEPDRLVLVHGRDGIQDDRVATHPFMHRRWMETVGYFVPPLFASDWNDMWLTEVADMIARRRYLVDVYTEHMHPVVGKGPMDQTHLERLERHRTQGVDQLYRDTADLRRQDADKLAAAIQRFQEES